MINLICALLVVIASVKSQDEEQYNKVAQILEDAGVDIEAFHQNVKDYWMQPEVDDHTNAIIKANLPEGVDGDQLIAELDKIYLSEGTDDEQWSEEIALIKEKTGAAAQTIIDKLEEYFEEPEHLAHFVIHAIEMLPPGADIEAINKKIEAALVEPEEE